jgi:hypothetical protein
MMMKNKDHLALIVFGFILVMIIFFIPNANAQVGQFEINPTQIQDPPKCSKFDVKADKAYIPFEIKIYHQFSRVNNVNFEQRGSSIPNTHTSPQLMIFASNALDDFQIDFEVNHDSDKLRAVFIEIWSQNNPSFSQVISYEGIFWCSQFNVKTAQAPTIPTRTEIIGEQAERAFEEMPLIAGAINSNTVALNQSIIWMFMVVVAALAVSAGQFFAYVGRRRKDKKRGTAFDNMIKVGAKYISGFKKEHDELKKQRVEEKNQINQFLDMANVEFRSFLVDLRKQAKLPEKSSLDVGNVRTVEEEAEQTSILRKLYESTSDQQLSKLLNFFKDKSSKLAKRHVTAITEESEKRIIKPIPKPVPDESLDVSGADEVIKEYGKERYRNLNDSKLRLLYRAFNTKYKNDPQEKYSNRLYKISEIINLRAKERVNSRNSGEEKK